MQNPWTRPTPRPVSQAISDHATLDEMRDCIRRHLSAALLECSALSRDLTILDPDAVMRDVRKQFDGLDEASPIQDGFTDAFNDSRAKLGVEPLRRGTMPSGVAL